MLFSTTKILKSCNVIFRQCTLHLYKLFSEQDQVRFCLYICQSSFDIIIYDIFFEYFLLISNGLSTSLELLCKSNIELRVSRSILSQDENSKNGQNEYFRTGATRHLLNSVENIKMHIYKASASIWTQHLVSSQILLKKSPKTIKMTHAPPEAYFIRSQISKGTSAGHAL